MVNQLLYVLVTILYVGTELSWSVAAKKIGTVIPVL